MSGPSPFQLAAPMLRAAGYPVIPLAAGSKRPAIAEWSEFCARLPDDAKHAQWMNWRAGNIGVCLGQAGGIMALDFDDDADGLHGKIAALVPESPVAKRGAKGWTAFYRFTGERSHGYSAGGVRVLDVLSTGKQTVLPPSIHPDGGEYRWLTPLTLADVTPDELPAIPPEAMAAVIRLFRPEPSRPPARFRADAYKETGRQEIVDALAFIPADDYDVWIRVGMAIKQGLGEAGFSLWDGWSGQSAKYVPAEMQRRWRSFHRSDVTIASLFYLAMDHGYVHARVNQPDAPEVTILPGGNLTPGKPTARREPRADPAGGADWLRPTGLVGRIAAWIDATAIYPLPELSVAAAITCAGAAMAHKVRSPTDLRTNFYALGLAASGAGKDHARNCIRSLLNQADLGALDTGEPASSAGLFTSLHDRGGRALILWDEFGRVLKQIGGRNASSHQADILTLLMKLFSGARGPYLGQQYANHDGKMTHKVIEQPCLSVYGTTVPENFFAAITHGDSVDGFLARFLVFESDRYALEAGPGGDLNDPPELLVAELRRWKDAPSNYDPRGNVDGVLRVCPMTVSYSTDSCAMIKSYAEAMRRRAFEESQARTGMSSIYARCAEHAVKLALAAHEGDDIGAEAMAWGIATADHSARGLIAAVKANVAENETERAGKRILAIVGGGGGEWVSRPW